MFFILCFIDRWISNRRKPKKLPSVKKYSKRTAHTFEIVREVNERGEMGKCGFYLHNERPSVIRHIVPGKYILRRLAFTYTYMHVYLHAGLIKLMTSAWICSFILVRLVLKKFLA